MVGSRRGATLAAINSPAPAQGDQAVITLGTWPDVHLVRLRYDGTRWVSRSEMQHVVMMDQNWLTQTGRGWGYLTASVGPAILAWDGIRPIVRAKDMIAAGFKLQDRLSARMRNPDSLGNVVVGYFCYDPNDVLSFTNDHATVEHPSVPYVETSLTSGYTFSSGSIPATIAVADTTGFLAGPSFISVDGIAIFYTALTGTSFTGCDRSDNHGATTQKYGTKASGAVVRQAFAVNFPMSPEGVGMGNVLSMTSVMSAASGGLFTSGWKDVQPASGYTGVQVFNQNGEPQKPPVLQAPPRRDLYCTVYAATPATGGPPPNTSRTTQIADLDYETRWVSP